MNETELIGIISIFVTLVFGFLAKRFKWVNSNLIPLQNLAIGIIAAIINYIITNDFSFFSAVFAILYHSLISIPVDLFNYPFKLHRCQVHKQIINT